MAAPAVARQIVRGTGCSDWCESELGVGLG